MDIKLPKEVEFILNTLNNKGHEAFVVGGCVRNSIMGLKPHDWDITTSAEPTEVTEIFEKEKFKVLPTGIKHGTVTVMVNNEGFEITTFRIDGEYKDGRRPSNVSFTKSIKEDLARRDFTINAIAFNPTDGLIDPFGGINDINNGVIRAVGDAKKRFEEDGLRILRAVRFCAKLNFKIDIDTANSMLVCSHNLNNVSMERKRDELIKILLTDNPSSINTFIGFSIINTFLPEFCEALHSIDKSKKNLSIRLAMMFHDCDTDTLQNELIRLRIDKRTIKQVVILVDNINDIPVSEIMIRRRLNQIGENNFRNLIEIWKLEMNNISSIEKKLNDIIERGDCVTLKQLAVKGDDLVAMGIEGKNIKSTLEKLLNIVIENPSLNVKEKLLKLI